MTTNNIKIGLFGFGVVGQGLNEVLRNARNCNASIEKICVRDKSKKRKVDESLVTLNPDDILENDKINLIVELIDDADAAYVIVKKALQNGKSVVSGNKKMLAFHLPELIEIQQKTGTALLYDASACGSIPVIRNLEEYYDNDLLKSVTGILNGSSNYILSCMNNKGMDYEGALKLAQEKGFAESNPVFDVGGFDSLYKLIILCVHSFGLYVHPDKVLNVGISNITPFDMQYANEKGTKIKLVARVERVSNDKVSLLVLPEFVSRDNYIYNVEDEYNGVVIEGRYYEKQFMFGKGAGGFPTGSSVLSDITARTHDYKYEYKKKYINTELSQAEEHEIRIYLRYKNLVDFSLFDFDEIEEKYVSKELNYVVGRIKVSKLMNIRKLLHKLDLFVVKLQEVS